MQTAVSIKLDMPQSVAEALLANLRHGLHLALTEHWYDDRYRTVPEQLRSQRILDDHPALAGHKRTIGALKAALTLPSTGSTK